MAAFYQRWYDRDPALSKAMDQLREASDRYQAQVALNIMKIILEHHMEEAAEAAGLDAEGLKLERWANTAEPHPLKRRWYDVNETLRAAMTMLQDCPDELQTALVPHICHMVEDTLALAAPDA
ncbi:MAG: hypothetical protein QE263_02555 [Vampirovibrionales bacterium]|nr:hypothetical protein [Vampirovibrionales bacterium]